MQPGDFTEQLRASTTGLGLVWAQTSTGVIGKAGDMPWHLPEDMSHFSRLTTGHPVIMGRKTWESFPDKYRPLPGRTNIVITRQAAWRDTPGAEGAVAVASLDDALLESQFVPGHETVWIIGGGEIFAQVAGPCRRRRRHHHRHQRRRGHLRSRTRLRLDRLAPASRPTAG